MKKAALVVVIFSVLASVVRADVIPSKLADQQAAADGKVVADRLTKLGVHPTSASQQVAALTDRDLRYFADQPGRLALAGQEKQDQDEDEDQWIGKPPTVGQLIWGGIWLLCGAAAVIVPIAIGTSR